MSSFLAKNSIKLLRKNSLKCFTSNFIRNQSSAVSEQPLVLNEVNDQTGFATISLNRPPMTSLTLELLQEFLKALDEVESKKYKGMILTSTSPTVFSAGIDINELINPDPKRLSEMRATYIDCCIKLNKSLFPTVAAVNGHAIGGGCFLAMTCEYRIMLPNFKIGLNETQLGIAFPEVAMLTTRNIIASRKAEMALTLGSVFPTDEALKIGLVDEIANDKADAIAKSEAFLRKFEKIPQIARGLTKQVFRKKIIDLMIANREKDVEAFVRFVLDPASQELMQSFLKDRK